MKRLLLTVAITGLAFAGFTPAQANDEMPQDHPVVFICNGTAGYDSTGTWSFETRVENLNPPGPGSLIVRACTAYAPDAVDPNPPPEPSTDPFGHLFWAGGAQPFGVGSVTLSGTGDFACGNGTLADEPNQHQGRLEAGGGGVVTSWTVTDWSAAFSDGVGEISGEVEGGSYWYSAKQTRTLSGTIHVEDGVATGNCDDSAGNVNWSGVFILE